MLDKLLETLRKKTNERLQAARGPRSDAAPAPVVYPGGDTGDHAQFEKNFVTILLVNLEHERTVRPGDPYLQSLADGTTRPGNPPIAISAHVMFVARFAKYADSLSRISQIAQLFQEHPSFDHENTPNLDDRIEKLVVELVTLPLSEQNHLWSILRTSYLPSLLYKVRMLVFRDEVPEGAPHVKETETTVEGLAP
jgi:hypothetical protein